MTHDRRSFIKRFGVTLGSLIVSGSLPGCGPRKGKMETDRSSNTRPLSAPEWGQLRQCWLDLRDLDVPEILGNNIIEAMRQHTNVRALARDSLAKDHRAVLEALIEKGHLEEPIARQMQTAFEEAASQVISSAGSCYAFPPFERKVREDLMQRTVALNKTSADLDPATVAKAQAAIAQDLTFFATLNEGHYDYSLLDKDFTARHLTASPEALEAARLLTRLLAETPD